MVAIIIPTLNEEYFIECCLDSVRLQTYPFELMDVMVVDGGSVDKTCEIVEKYSEKYPNVRLLDNPQRIQSAAFNIGVRYSKAPIIIRLDAHAIYNEKYVDLCRKHLLEHQDYGNVGGICKTLPIRNTLMAEANAILNKSMFGIGGSKFRVGTSACCVDTVPFGAFRREVVEKIGGMREDMPRAEDNEYNSRIHKYGYKVFLDPEIVSTYYARDTYRGSVRQMYNNGDSIGHLFYIDHKAIGLRHFVPFLFVLGIIIGLIFGFFYHPFWWLLCVGLGIYFVLNLFATINECCKYGWKYFFLLPILFFSVHFSYGFGTIIGLLRKFTR
jgi:glycosyltransferase involved in cell wall biosynthesis